MISKQTAYELGYFNAKVVKPFSARWVNPIWLNGKLTDCITERTFNVGEIVYCNTWRPEGMHLKRECDQYSMFVPFEYFENLELVNR